MSQEEQTPQEIPPTQPTEVELLPTPEEELTEDQKAWCNRERTAIRKQFQKEYDDSVLKFREELAEQNKKGFQQVVEQWKKEQTPPTQDEVQKVLDAEFPEFTINVDLGKGKEHGIIRELGAKKEREFVRLLKEKTSKHFNIISGVILDFAAGQSTEEKILSLFDSADPLSDLICHATMLVLTSALGREVTLQEIDDHISHTRQLMFLQAQRDANRIRDFFSLGSRFLRT